MKSIFKKLNYLFLSVTLFLVACETEESLIISSPEAKFKLNTPGISSIFLNFSLPDNPAFTITWNDEVSTATAYNVEMSLDETFTNPVNLGATDKSNFSMTVSNFNTAINQTGVTNFRDVAIYMRVNNGSETTNNILLLVTTYPMNPPSFTGVANGDSFVLSLANNDATALTVGWEDAILQSSLGVDVEYIIEAATPGTDFADPIEVAKVMNQNSIAITNAKLNTIAIASGIAVDTAGDLELRIKSQIKDENTDEVLERINAAITINVTTYLTVLDLTTPWGIIGSAANDWGNAGPDLPFFSTDTDGILVAYVTLTTGEIKFRQNNSWDAPNINYGDNGADGSLEEAGANIVISTAGSYKITMNLNTQNYTIEVFSLGIIGSAYNDWGNAGPDFMLEYDQYSDVFRGIVTLLDGEMKFRMNNAWDVNYGDSGVDGTLDAGGDNIISTAGNYIVTVDLNDLTYTLEKIDNIWGLVGEAYNDWGATPDAQFTRDWSKPFNDVWILRDVTLIDGEYKFRANNAWDISYGDNGSDGTLELGGDNLNGSAGTYTFTIDFTDLNNITYTKI